MKTTFFAFVFVCAMPLVALAQTNTPASPAVKAAGNTSALAADKAALSTDKENLKADRAAIKADKKQLMADHKPAKTGK